MIETLDDVLIDEELTEGARNAIRTCLRVRSGEKVTLVTDLESLEIAASLEREAERVGGMCRVFVLEDFAPRPHKDMPQEILTDLATSAVSIYAVVGKTGELRTRMQMTSVITQRRIRHAHMININKQIMMEGMRADFNRVDEISTRVWSLGRQARRIQATTPAGTDIDVEFSPSIKWIKTSGIISPDKWGNLPGGEVFTSPSRLNGTFVVDGVVGDYLCAKYGNLEASPLTIRVTDSRIKEISCRIKQLEDEFWAYTHTDENSDRVGEFAIGTNIQLKQVIGNILQDEKMPGIHIAFGHPYAEHTGAQWKSSTHIDVVGTRFSIWIDEQQIMNDGRFLAFPSA